MRECATRKGPVPDTFGVDVRVRPGCAFGFCSYRSLGSSGTRRVHMYRYCEICIPITRQQQTFPPTNHRYRYCNKHAALSCISFRQHSILLSCSTSLFLLFFEIKKIKNVQQKQILGFLDPVYLLEYNTVLEQDSLHTTLHCRLGKTKKRN